MKVSSGDAHGFLKFIEFLFLTVGVSMDVGALFNQWLDTLAGLATGFRTSKRERRAISVIEQDGLFALRSAVQPGGKAEPLPLAVLAVGSRPTEAVLKGLRGKFIQLEYPAAKVIKRNLSAPAQARDFLAGVVRNQIDRLSPWPGPQILYGYKIAAAASDQAMLEVVVSIALRKEVEALRTRFAETGLNADRIIVQGEDGLPIVLWSKAPAAGQAPQRNLRLWIGGSLGGLAAACLALCVWGVASTSSMQEESVETLQQIEALQKRDAAQFSPQMLSSLPPKRRAWAAKEFATPMTVLLETLSRSIPDNAYLSEFAFGDGKVRVSGLADEAPPLIGALESTRRFSDVHFIAPVTRGQDNNLARFALEARVEPKFEQWLKD